MATNTEDLETLDACMLLLQQECPNPKDLQASINTLLKIYRNIEQNRGEEKYYTLKTTNKTFADRVWQWTGAQQFLLATGWVEVDETVVLTDDAQVNTAIQQLQQFQLEVCPDHGPATDKAAKTKGTSQTGQSPKEKVLSEERKKLLAKIQRDKEEKRRIAEQIKADRQETNTKKHKDAKARQRTFGANINRFEDIGVNLNRGGG